MNKCKLMLCVTFAVLHLSGCGGSKAPNEGSGAIDKLIALYNSEPNKSQDPIFARVLQNLKNGSLKINDRFNRRDPNGGQKIDGVHKWEEEKKGKRGQAEWQTFVTRIVEVEGIPVQDPTPYLAYAKEAGANFKAYDMYGRTLLHLIIGESMHKDDLYSKKVLDWLLKNTDAKDLAYSRTKNERDGKKTGNTPLEYGGNQEWAITIYENNGLKRG